MTKREDNIAQDAAKAAQLIKTTAEQTATTLNIQYMQRDISAINTKLDKIVEAQEGRIKDLEDQIAKLSDKQDRTNKTVAIGIGVASTLAVVFPFLVKFISK